MIRIPEPILMTQVDQCRSFSNSNREYVRNLFIESLTSRCQLQGTILNLGCGPCDFDIALCKTNSKINIISVDGSSAMIDIARKKIKNYPIKLVCDVFNNINYQSDITISSLTLHHQLNPIDFWESIKANTKHNGYVFVMDMIRPESYDQIATIINQLAATEDDIFKTDFKNSLAASFTLDEIKDQLRDANLNLVVEVVGKLEMIVLIYGYLC
jgi:SAM-dependent methyltransferase